MMMKPDWKSLLHVAIASVLIAALFSGTVSASNNLTAHFIDVGQGDRELLQFNNKSILIDAVEQDMGPRVESYLKDHGVSSIDLLVATHPHSDHIAA